MIGSLLSGLLSGLSFPTSIGSVSFSLGGLAWFALVPSYLALVSVRQGKRAFWGGFSTGLLLYGVSLYWIYIAMHLYGKVPVWSSLTALVLLVTILSLYLGGAFLLSFFLKKRGVPLSLSFPALWLLQDFCRNYFPLGGFSWSSLAYSQGEMLTLIQIADLTGPYGVTFLILFANAFFGEVVLFLTRRRIDSPGRLAWIFVALIGPSILYGLCQQRRIPRLFEGLPEKKISLIQGNIPQEEKWLSENVEKIIGRQTELSLEAERDSRPDLIIWPEAAFTAVIPPDAKSLDVVDSLRTPLLMGAVSFEGRLPDDWPPPAGSDFRLYNSAWVVRPRGILMDVYRKNHLVPMGEYIPMKKVFFFLEKIVPGFADFTPGDGYPLLSAAGMKAGVTICFEDLFPEISRRLVRAGADILVNMTNDAWYERSSAVLQHLEFSRFRAIENRRYLARATNTGVTAVFDPTGREVARAPLFQEAVLPAVVKLGSPKTFYARWGDVFVAGLMVLLFLFATLPAPRSLRRSSGTDLVDRRRSSGR